MTGTDGHEPLSNVDAPCRPIATWPLTEPVLPDDFRVFLRLLTDTGLEYLLIGG